MKQAVVASAVAGGLALLATSCTDLWSDWGLTGLGLNDMAIQQALDALPAGGGEVRLKAGVYTIQRPVLLGRDGLTLRGAGAATVLRLADRANCPVVILGPTENFPRQPISRVVLADLTIDGNRTNQQSELWQTTGPGNLIRNNGVTVRAVHDGRVERVTVFNCRSGGVVTEHGVRRLTVAQLNSFNHEFDGLACYRTEDSVFSHLLLHHNPGAGISLDLGFDGNVISDTVLSENDVGIFMRESRLNTFNGLVIRASRNMGVFISHAAEKNAAGEWIPAPDTQCEGNTFNGLVIRECFGPAFRVNETSCSNTLLVAAQFVNNPTGLSVAAEGLVMVRGLIERATPTLRVEDEPVDAGEF